MASRRFSRSMNSAPEPSTSGPINSQCRMSDLATKRLGRVALMTRISSHEM